MAGAPGYTTKGGRRICVRPLDRSGGCGTLSPAGQSSYFIGPGLLTLMPPRVLAAGNTVTTAKRDGWHGCPDDIRFRSDESGNSEKHGK